MKYDSFDNKITVVTGKSKNTSMKSAACTVKVNGKDYAVFMGGWNGQYVSTCVIVDFDGVNINVVDNFTLPEKRNSAGICVVTLEGDDYIVIGGGYGGTYYRSVYLYRLYRDANGLRLEKVASGNLSSARDDIQAVKITVKGVQYAVFPGGFDSSIPGSTTKIDVMSVTTNSVSIAATGNLEKPVQLYGCGVVNVNSEDYVIVCGGQDNTNTPTDLVQVVKYDGTTVKVVATGNLTEARWAPAATKMHINGVDYIVVVGGNISNTEYSNKIDVVSFDGSNVNVISFISMFVLTFVRACTLKSADIEYALF